MTLTTIILSALLAVAILAALFYRRRYRWWRKEAFIASDGWARANRENAELLKCNEKLFNAWSAARRIPKEDWPEYLER